ncbi:hypothetical protein FB45DRAFT_1029054 [Roridomyces roridus]|uniref:Uncharacterized protein n=1 Tax=Roridomyces roridus TaxID=1738132 RepID=A0AAD7FN65_9AGAR|nr:hypothetical protein FB45DRAFT_1029054 [Roridomyces roridus]
MTPSVQLPPQSRTEQASSTCVSLSLLPTPLYFSCSMLTVECFQVSLVDCLRCLDKAPNFGFHSSSLCVLFLFPPTFVTGVARSVSPIMSCMQARFSVILYLPKLIQAIDSLFLPSLRVTCHVHRVQGAIARSITQGPPPRLILAASGPAALARRLVSTISPIRRIVLKPQHPLIILIEVVVRAGWAQSPGSDKDDPAREQPTYNLRPDDPNYYSTDHALCFKDPFPLPLCAEALERYKPLYAKSHTLRHIPLPNRFSSDWRYWDHGTEVHSVEVWVRRKYGVQGPIEPMAFLVDQQESFFAFAANGEYYFWDGAATVLKKYVRRFDSHEDFLPHLIHSCCARRS